MSTDIAIEPSAPYPPQPGMELDVEGAPSSANCAEGGNSNNRKTPQRFRGRDKQPDSALLRHVTHCSICNHPEREAIEQAILHWYSPTVIAHEFNLADRRIVYRHAQAFGLFNIRAEQSRHALGFLIEQAQSIVPSADAIIRAVRALACIDDRGHWHEPRKEVVITHRYEDATSYPADEDATSAPAADENRCEVETPVPQPRKVGSNHSASRPRRQRVRSAAPKASETQHKSWSPLRLFSTHLLRKDRRNSRPVNKTAKTSRHTFGMFDAAEKRAVAPASRRRF